jgi:hypothetical protein
MDKYENNKLVEQMDAIILLNSNYESLGLKKGYIGTVVANLIEKYEIILVDFFNPFTGEDIYIQAKIKTDDFRVISPSKKDQELVKVYKDLFR